MIELRNVDKIFTTSSKQQNVHALKNVNLHVEANTIYGVIGFSGAGKSTLIRCINLLERPTNGEVFVDGENLIVMKEKELRAIRKKIGMIFQHFNLMSSRTVAQNIAFPLRGSGLRKEEIQKKVKDLLKLVELSDKEFAYPSQLSGGQKQRVAIARALASDPKVLLCDEATSALDPQTTQSILRLLKEVNKRLGITIVLITHEMGVIKEICDRVAIMENGEVVEEGSVVDIFSKPKQPVTQKFIHSTSSINRIYEMIEEHAPITDLTQGAIMVHLKYDGTSTKEALLSHLSREFQMDTNIIFGNVEVIQGIPLGDMIVILSSTSGSVEEAISYLQSHEVSVEVLKQC